MKNLSRRHAVRAFGAAVAAVALPSTASARLTADKKIRLGVIADLHGGLATDAEQRLDAFLKDMGDQDCDALVQLGDFAYPNEKHQVFADKFNAAHDNTIHVIGNHEFDYGLKRADCYQSWGIGSSYYRRDIGDLRILVLDGNDRGSPSHGGGYPSFVGDKQQAWLERELETTEKAVLVLSHQPLAGNSAVDNATELQELLAQYSDKIVACLNGHSHVDDLLLVHGVPYLHINSASYFWVGGKTRMATYTKPLYTTLTIDPSTATLGVSACESDWADKSPKELGYFEGEGRPSESIVVPQIRGHHVSSSDLKVMAWNIWGRLNQDPRYTVDDTTARERTIEIIQESGADVVAMIETYGSAQEIADALGFHYHTSAADANLCIFSRYPMSDIELLAGLNPFSFIAATITLPRGQQVRLYDIWLTSGGRHIVGIKDSSISDEAFSRGDDLRGKHLKELLSHPTFKRDWDRVEEVPLIVAGDFNCVSHLDYSDETSAAELNYERKQLSIHVSEAMAELGMIDTYRVANPNLTADSLGHTWTTVGRDYVFESGKGFVQTDDHPRPQYQDLYSRIDYIYSRGEKLEVANSAVISRHPEYPERKFPAFPSDHAAVLTTFKVK